MKIILKYKDDEGKYYKYTKEMTIKQANEIYKENLKNNKSIVKVWLVYQGCWHSYTHKILKEIQNEI